MAIQPQGFSGVVAEVDGTTFRALRVTPRPVDFGALGFYSLSMTSGLMAVSLGANVELFQFRWPDATRLAVVYKVEFSAAQNVAATTAALLSARATIARGWTAAGSGGTRAVLTGNNAKLRTSMGTSLVNDAGISTTAGLTIGTKTLDTQDVGGVAYNALTGAITTQPAQALCPLVAVFDAGDGGMLHPMVFAQNEGFVIRAGAAHPAGMTWHFVVNVTWAEVAAY